MLVGRGGDYSIDHGHKGGVAQAQQRTPSGFCLLAARPTELLGTEADALQTLINFILSIAANPAINEFIPAVSR